MVSAAEHLVPLFEATAASPAAALQTALSAIAAYNPDSRADYINIARTIAFSMAALALLGDAAAPDRTHAEKMRAYARATTLHNAADKSERTMMQRRRWEKANPPSKMLDWMDPKPEAGATPPVQEAPINEPEIHAAVAEATTVQAHRAQPQAKPPQPNDAIRHTAAPAPPRQSYKSSLLERCAMPPPVPVNGAHAAYP